MEEAKAPSPTGGSAGRLATMGKTKWAHQLASAGIAALWIISVGIVFTGFWDDAVNDLYASFKRPPPASFVGWAMKAVLIIAVTVAALMFFRPALLEWWRERQRRPSPFETTDLSLDFTPAERVEGLESLRNTVGAVAASLREQEDVPGKVKALSVALGELRQLVANLDHQEKIAAMDSEIRTTRARLEELIERATQTDRDLLGTYILDSLPGNR